MTGSKILWETDWDTMTVDVGAREYGTSIVLDSLGIPHITDGSSTWIIESLPTGINRPFLAIDSEDWPHISL